MIRVFACSLALMLTASSPLHAHAGRHTRHHIGHVHHHHHHHHQGHGARHLSVPALPPAGEQERQQPLPWDSRYPHTVKL